MPTRAGFGVIENQIGVLGITTQQGEHIISQQDYKKT